MCLRQASFASTRLVQPTISRPFRPSLARMCCRSLLGWLVSMSFQAREIWSSRRRCRVRRREEMRRLHKNSGDCPDSKYITIKISDAVDWLKYSLRVSRGSYTFEVSSTRLWVVWTVAKQPCCRQLNPRGISASSNKLQGESVEASCRAQ